MELNIWTSSTIEKLVPNPGKDGWTVTVKKADGSTRIFKPGHVILAHGFGGGVPKMPYYPGMVSSEASLFNEVRCLMVVSVQQDTFEGKLIHSSKHVSAREHKGKKVVVIGACTSGHDIAHDHYTHGVGKFYADKSSLLYS